MYSEILWTYGLDLLAWNSSSSSSCFFFETISSTNFVEYVFSIGFLWVEIGTEQQGRNLLKWKMGTGQKVYVPCTHFERAWDCNLRHKVLHRFRYHITFGCGRRGCVVLLWFPNLHHTLWAKFFRLGDVSFWNCVRWMKSSPQQQPLLAASSTLSSNLQVVFDIKTNSKSTDLPCDFPLLSLDHCRLLGWACP